MSEPKLDESFYDLLKVDPRATVAEIVSAYHTAKNAFAKDSVATYSLFSPEEAETVLAKLEQAYLTLSNLERRAEYDRRLLAPEDSLENMMRGGLNASHSTPPPSFNIPAITDPAPVAPPIETTETTFTAPAAESTSPATVAPVAPVATPAPEVRPEECSGHQLKENRERRGLSVEDVSRITKIPSKFLRSIEADDLKKLPARVYIQGFIKNLAVLYKLDPAATAKAYLLYLDRVAPPGV